MFRQIIFTSLLTIGSAITLVNPATAQFDAQTTRLLQQANQANASAYRYMNNVAIPQAQSNQNYLNSLYQYCLRGNTSACQQYRSLSNVRLQQYNNSIQQLQNYSNTRRYSW